MCLLEFERDLQKAGTSFKSWCKIFTDANLGIPNINATSWQDLIMSLPTWERTDEGEKFWGHLFNYGTKPQPLENADVPF